MKWQPKPLNSNKRIQLIVNSPGLLLSSEQIRHLYVCVFRCKWKSPKNDEMLKELNEKNPKREHSVCDTYFYFEIPSDKRCKHYKWIVRIHCNSIAIAHFDVLQSLHLDRRNLRNRFPSVHQVHSAHRPNCHERCLNILKINVEKLKVGMKWAILVQNALDWEGRVKQPGDKFGWFVAGALLVLVFGAGVFVKIFGWIKSVAMYCESVKSASLSFVTASSFISSGSCVRFSSATENSLSSILFWLVSSCAFNPSADSSRTLSKYFGKKFG